MNICLVTAFPPSRRGLNEYGYHIARELRRNPLLSVTILGDELPSPGPELPGFSVTRCWDFNRLSNPICLLREIRRLQPDIVWFNIGFASYGNKALPATVGLTMPALVRLAGFRTHVTLHQLMDTVDLNDAGVRFQRIYKLGGALITRILLMSDSVSVLLPAYRTILQEKYGAGSVHVRRHGILSGRPEYPDFSKRGKPEHRVLAFGKWGTYKRLEPMIEAFRAVADAMPPVRLVVAGGNHPNTPGYVESVAQKYSDDPRIEFTGYVPEEQLPDLFRSATVTVMPYSSSAGCSGVAHLALQYGVPIVASDISDFRQLSEEEGLAIEFFKTGNIASLTETLRCLLESPERQQEMAVQNFSVALHMTMPRVIRDYLRSFDLAERGGALRSVSRLRRLPRWMPLRSTVGRLMLRNWARWRCDPYDSVEGNGHANGFLDSSLDGYGVGYGRLRGSNGTLGEALQATGVPKNSNGNGNGHNGRHDILPAVLGAYSNNGDPESEQRNRLEQLPAAQLVRFARSGSKSNGRNGKHGGNGSASGHNGNGRIRAPHSRGKIGEEQSDGGEGYDLERDRDSGAA
ncbi:MAG: group 1 glycosyl transferase [Acidobacteria bacterium]|nr:MAG: group 1 glycosyl transferase [Acidobacteriota bacterium]